MDAVELVGWVGGALVVARLVPQAARLVRTGSVAGVSAAGSLCWLGNDLGWVTYGVRAGMVPLWLPGIFLLVLDVVVAAVLARRLPWRELAPGAAWIGVVAGAAVAGQGALGLALIAGSATGTLPHAWRAVRSRDLSGIAPATWILGVVDGVLWGIYGAAHHDPAVSWYAALTLVTAGVVLWRLHASRVPAPDAELRLA